MTAENIRVTIQIQTLAKHVSEVKSLLGKHAIGPIQVLVAFPHNSRDEGAYGLADQNLAREIAEAIRPKGKQTMRAEALKAAFGNYDSFVDQAGEIDGGMRVALGALSRALRPFARHLASPMDLIAVRERQYLDGGGYRGTSYKCTTLGKLVCEELKAMKVI